MINEARPTDLDTTLAAMLAVGTLTTNSDITDSWQVPQLLTRDELNHTA